MDFLQESAPLLVDTGLVSTLFTLMGDKKDDDEFVLQIAFTFHKFLMQPATRAALLHTTQAVMYLIDLVHDKNAEASARDRRNCLVPALSTHLIAQPTGLCIGFHVHMPALPPHLPTWISVVRGCDRSLP